MILFFPDSITKIQNYSHINPLCAEYISINQAKLSLGAFLQEMLPVCGSFLLYLQLN